MARRRNEKLIYFRVNGTDEVIEINPRDRETGKGWAGDRKRGMNELLKRNFIEFTLPWLFNLNLKD